MYSVMDIHMMEKKTRIQRLLNQYSGCRHGNNEPLGSWLTLAAVFANNILVVMPQCGFVIYYDQIVGKYNSNKANVGVAYFLFFCMSGIVGMLVSPFIMRCGTWKISTLAAIIQMLAFIACAYSPELWMFTITYGLIAGCGRGIVMITSVLIVQQVFDKNRGLATGIACLGYNVSDIVSPILLAYLLEEYGLTGSLLLLAGIQSHSIAFSLLYRTNACLSTDDSNNEKYPSISQCQDIKRQDESKSLEFIGSSKHLSGYANDTEVLHQKPNSQQLWRDHKDDNYIQIKEKLPSDLTDRASLDILDKSTCSTKIRAENTNANVHAKNLLQVQMFYSSGSALAQSLTSLHQNVQSFNNDQEENAWYRISCKETLKHYLDFTILKNKFFVLLLIIRQLWICTKFGILTHIVSAAVLAGISEKMASFNMSVYGMICLLTVVISSMVLNHKTVNKEVYLAVSLVFLVLSAIMSLMATTCSKLFIASMVILGISEGMGYSCHFLVVLNMLGLEKFPKAVAFLELMGIPALLAAAPFLGFLVDVTSQYVIPFLVLLGISIVAASLAVLLAVLMWSHNRLIPEIRVEADERSSHQQMTA